MTSLMMTRNPSRDFRTAVEMRYQKDLIMNFLPVLALSLVPVFLFFLFYLMCITASPFNRLNEYRESWIVVTFMMEILILGIITRMMYTRLMDHSERDILWRWSLISYASSYGADTRELIIKHSDITEKEKFRAKLILSSLSTLLFVLMVFIIICVIPELMYDSYETGNFLVRISVNLIADGLGFYDQAIIAVILMPLYTLILVPMFLIASIKVLGFPASHAKDQSAFTEELSRCLRKKGIFIPPMVETIQHRPFYLHIIFTIITGGLYLFYIMVWAFRGMNTHLMNQWVYEEEMLEFIETNGRNGFDERHTYNRSMPTVMTRQDRSKLMKNIREQVRRDNRRPYPLIIAELFVIAILVTYIFSLVATGCEIVHDYDVYRLVSGNLGNIGILQWLNIIMVVVNLYLLRNTIKSLLCVGSRRPDSWRMVTRSCLTFVVPLWVYYFINSNSLGNMFNFNPFVTTGVLYIVFLMMILSVSIREFYRPVNKKMPKLKRWLAYLICKRKGGFYNPEEGIVSKAREWIEQISKKNKMGAP